MITEEMTVEEILNEYPAHSQRLAQVLQETGLQCVGCHQRSYDTLKTASLCQGLEQDEIEHLVHRLNAVIEEKVDVTSITLTPAAALAFQEIAKSEGIAGAGLRLDCIPGGCSGYQYALDFEEEPSSEEDVCFSSHGVSVYVHKEKIPYLLGVKIDYRKGLQGGGFQITNPNAKSSCGCGKSQSY